MPSSRSNKRPKRSSSSKSRRRKRPLEETSTNEGEDEGVSISNSPGGVDADAEGEALDDKGESSSDRDEAQQNGNGGEEEEEEEVAEDDDEVFNPDEGKEKRGSNDIEEEDDAMDDDEEEDFGDEAVVRSSDGRRRSVNREGRPAEAGVIEEVYCENFMCHQKLRVTFCRNVNFIHGQNGSGKSAILAAIQICLGAGARRTHRARNIKELIKKDCDRSKVRVTLLNGGDDAYKTDVYGDKITIERCITTGSGYNGYKLLDSKGVEKSRSKKDLDEMLDRL